MIAELFDELLAQHGPQGWWPADDPFEIMAGAVLVQRTAWRNAARAIERLKLDGCLTPEQLADIEAERLENLIRPAGFYRVKALRLSSLASFVVTSGGVETLARQMTATLRTSLLMQPGIGPETADAILAYAFGRPVFVVDAYARRLFARLAIPGPLPSDDGLKADCESTLRAPAQLNELHALIVAHGQRYCAATPACEPCRLRPRCGYASTGGPLLS